MSNKRDNTKAINAFRGELKSMVKDIKEIDQNVLNKAVNVGLRYAKKHTPVGKSSPGHTGGFMRKSWSATPLVKSKRGFLRKGGCTKELVNTADYARYVNDGHRIVRNGVTLGFVKGQHILEKSIRSVENAMVREFRKEIERVARKHD